jgi:hypothetical protein
MTLSALSFAKTKTYVGQRRCVPLCFGCAAFWLYS